MAGGVAEDLEGGRQVYLSPVLEIRLDCYR